MPVLEGTRSGLTALGHLIESRRPARRQLPPAHRPDSDRQATWRPTGPGPLQRRGRLRSPARLRHRHAGHAGRGRRPTRPRRRPASIGFPVVLKTDEPSVAHKSDVGGVVLGVADPAAAAAAYDDLASTARLPGAGVGHRPRRGGAGPGRGARSLIWGRSWWWARAACWWSCWPTASVRLAPMDEDGAARAVDRLRVSALLDGVRGAPPADRRRRRPAPWWRCPDWPPSWATRSKPSTSTRCGAARRVPGARRAGRGPRRPTTLGARAALRRSRRACAASRRCPRCRSNPWGTRRCRRRELERRAAVVGDRHPAGHDVDELVGLELPARRARRCTPRCPTLLVASLPQGVAPSRHLGPVASSSGPQSSSSARGGVVDVRA